MDDTDIKDVEPRKRKREYRDEVEKERHRRYVDGLRAAAATANGRWFLWGLIKACGIGQAVYQSGDEDRDLWILQGRKDIGLKIQEDMTQYCIHDYLRMLIQGDGNRVDIEPLLKEPTNAG